MSNAISKGASVKRTFGLFTSTLLVIGIIIGSGIFKKIVPMAQTGLSEWQILLAWVIAGIVSLLGALTVAGLASLTEESGGSYEYFRIGFGNFVSFLSGWAEFTIIGSGTIAALAFLLSQCFGWFITISNPMESWAHISIGNFIFPFADSGMKILGIGSIVVLSTINFISTKKGAMFNNVITVAKVLGILLLIFVGVFYQGSVETSQSSVAQNNPDQMLFISAFFTALLGAFWAFDGWAFIPSVSGEIISPKKNVPRAIVLGVVIVTVIYVLVNYAFLNALPVSEIRQIGEEQIGAVVIMERLLGPLGTSLVLILISLSVLGALNSNIITFPRKYYRMAQMKYFFKNAVQVHPKFETPIVAFIYSGIVSCMLLLTGTFDMLSDMVIFTAFLFYGLLAVVLIKLKRNGTIKSKVVGYPWAPIIFLIFSAGLTINTIWAQPKLSLIGLFLVLSGIPFYYYFGWKQKREESN